jgi:hypothetical protein
MFNIFFNFRDDKTKIDSLNTNFNFLKYLFYSIIHFNLHFFTQS